MDIFVKIELWRIIELITLSDYATNIKTTAVNFWAVVVLYFINIPV